MVFLLVFFWREFSTHILWGYSSDLSPSHFESAWNSWKGNYRKILKILQDWSMLIKLMILTAKRLNFWTNIENELKFIYFLSFKIYKNVTLNISRYKWIDYIYDFPVIKFNKIMSLINKFYWGTNIHTLSIEHLAK